MNVLLASTAGAGHIGPLIPIADTLSQQANRVEFIVPPGAEHLVDRRGYLVTTGGTPPAEEMDRLWERFAGVGKEEQRWIAEREAFASRYTQAMLPAIARVAELRRPDLVVREPCEYASAVVAVAHDIPHATVAISFSATEWSVVDFVRDILDTYDPRVSAGIKAAPFLARFPPSLDPSPFPDTRRYRVPPVIGDDRTQRDLWPSERGRHLYVTFGSRVGAMPDARQVFNVVLEAVTELDADVLFTVGRAFDMSTLDSAPANVRVARWIPQDEVLAHCDAVICHGGSGTTFAALAHGVPLGFIPLFADQPANAKAVVGVGAGIALEDLSGTSGAPMIDRSHAPAILAMAEELLDDRSYRDAARDVAKELVAQPDVAELAGELMPWAASTAAARCGGGWPD